MISAPEPLATHHTTQAFDCGEHGLNEWLKRKALKAHVVGGSARTYVVCSPDDVVCGYYALATGAIKNADTPGRVRRNMPDPIPVILLGRLAVDQRSKGQGVGCGLLKGALLRSVVVAPEIGVRAVITHALNDQARSFYLKHGFYDSPANDYTMMLTITEIERILGI